MDKVCCRLQDRTAIVTGGASGIGQASVLRLLSEGARVVLADINAETAMATLETVRRNGDGDRVRFFHCNVTDEADMVRLVQFAVSEFGRLDCMVNNAGTGGALGRLVDTSVEDWDRTQDLVLRSVFLGTKAAARAMIDQGSGGSIVNMSSVVALRGGWAGAAYSAAKAAILNLTCSAAVELASHRIRCNAILPGTIITPLLLRGADPEEFSRVVLETQIWPEPGLAEHIASVVAFLASDDSRFIVGQGIIADGGQVVAVGHDDLYRGDHPLGRLLAGRFAEHATSRFDRGTTAMRSIPQSIPVRDNTPRTVLITGVSRGLGLALAERLIELGHTVVGCARSESALAPLRARWGAPHRFDAVDIAADDQVRRWAEGLLGEREAPNLLVNNAAVVGTHAAQVWRQTTEEFEQVFRVNVFGMINVIRHFVPAMLRRMSGVIVNFSSGWGRGAAPKTGPYCASKWAVEGLTRALACELPPKMAAVSLHPGIIHTETMEQTFGEDAEKYATPEEWARIAAPFLLNLRPSDNGLALSVPGMSEFRGMRTPRPFANRPAQRRDGKQEST